MDDDKVTCANCLGRYDKDLPSCPNCGSTNLLKDEPPPEPPGMVRTVESEFPDDLIPKPYELEQHRMRTRRTIVTLILTILIVVIAGRALYNHLDNTTHAETVAVVGFSWKTEVDVYSDDEYNRTEVLEGTGKTFSWPNVPGKPGEVLDEPKRHYYLMLRGLDNKVHKPYEVTGVIWKQLSFNDKVTAQIDGLGNIDSVTIR